MRELYDGLQCMQQFHKRMSRATTPLARFQRNDIFSMTHMYYHLSLLFQDPCIQEHSGCLRQVLPASILRVKR